MASVGAILRNARENQGRGMAEVAEQLCLTQRYLRAIEEDDVDSLPGVFFYKSFARQYAAAVGVDAKQIQPGLDALTVVPVSDVLPPPSPLRALDPIVSASNRRYFHRRSLALSIAGLIAALAGSSGVYAWWSRPRHVEPSPRQLATVIMPVSAASEVPPEINVTTTQDPDGTNRVALNLAATEKTWLSISSGGRVVFSGILEPSQTKTINAMDATRMMIGNAGGVDIQWNGKPIGPIGKSGEVRVVLFTPDNFQILPPAPPTESL